MPQEAEAGRRFARDMRRIREAHNLSVGDLHDETKIPLSLIQAFEETGLFDHPQFNRVYLRSFVRTYANVVGVDAEHALEALEDALTGSYAGALAASYLGEEQPEAQAEEEEIAEQKAAAEEQQTGRQPAEKAGEEREPPIVSTTSEAAASYDEPEEEQAPEEEEVDEEWAAQSPPSAKRAAAGTAAGAGAAADARSRGAGAASRASDRSRHRRDRGADRRWILAGSMVVIVAVIVWILVSVLGDGDPRTAQPIAAADTVQTQDTTQAQQQQQTRTINIPAIGDTMNVHIIAAQGKVDPIRVTVDDDLRRPYWIEQGDSMAFNPQNRIVIEELLDNINLKVEGIEYPTDRRDPQNRIVITRDTLQSYFASLQQGQL